MVAVRSYARGNKKTSVWVAFFRFANGSGAFLRSWKQKHICGGRIFLFCEWQRRVPTLVKTKNYADLFSPFFQMVAVRSYARGKNASAQIVLFRFANGSGAFLRSWKQNTSMQIIFSVLRMVVARSYACENIRNMLRFNLANGIGALVHSEKYRHYFFLHN